jgi:transitional endoplasmic reticulum ATPase
LIFFDEFEALGTKRDTDSSAMKRIIPELLVEIQKAEESDGIVLIMAATNRPWDIDSAFLRPGRFSTSIHIPLPDAPSRKAIIDAQMVDVPRSDDWCVEKSVRLSEGFSGADIVAVCERLKDRAIERVIRGDGASCITDADVEQVFQHTRSSVLKEDLDRIEWYRKQAGS